MTYSDVLSMPTYERRFFIGQLIKSYERQNNEDTKKSKKVYNNKLKK